VQVTLLDYTWTCNFRATMTSEIRSSNPFYAMIYTTPFPEGFQESIPLPCLTKAQACHCLETVHYMGTLLDRRIELTEIEKNHIEMIQNNLANFVRTGDPNDWTGNPRQS